MICFTNRVEEISSARFVHIEVMSFVKLCLNAFYFSVNHFTEQAEKLVDVTARQIKIIEGTEKALDKLIETSSESIERDIRQAGRSPSLHLI